MTVDDKALDLCCCRYPEDIFSVCRVMTDEGLGDPVDRFDDEYDLDDDDDVVRLSVFNDMMLEMNAEECLDHTYDAFLADTGNTEWGDPTLFTWRPWLWQTCTEFGWYQTTNQVKENIFHSFE